MGSKRSNIPPTNVNKNESIHFSTFKVGPAICHKSSRCLLTTHLECLSGSAVGDVDFAVAGAAAHEQAGLVGRVLNETDVAHRTVVHRELHLDK